MRKPEGYDSAPVYTGEGQALPAGGYVCTIVKAEETSSRGGRPMLALALDIAEGEYEGHFRRQYERAKQSNPDAKWNGVFRQLTDGSSLPFFKGLVTSLEVSNDFKWDFDERKLKGKLIGALFGREQYMGTDGKLKWSTKCQAVRSVKNIRDGNFEIPEDKPLAGGAGVSYSGAADVNARFDDDDDLPF